MPHTLTDDHPDNKISALELISMWTLESAVRDLDRSIRDLADVMRQDAARQASAFRREHGRAA
jgi:hypothetical protein